MVGNLEIQLYDGHHTMMMDYLGVGSVIGFNNVLLNAEIVYQGRVRSPRLKIIEVPLHLLFKHMKNFPVLKEQLHEKKKELVFNGPPTIDYLIRYDLADKNLLMKIMQNFKK